MAISDEHPFLKRVARATAVALARRMLPIADGSVQVVGTPSHRRVGRSCPS